MNYFLKGPVGQLCMLCALLSASTGFAQLEMSARIKSSRTVLYEPVILTLNVENTTPRAISLDGDQGLARLDVEIESTPGRRIRQVNVPLLSESVILPPREKVTLSINLTEAYELRETGPFTIRVRMDWDGKSFYSGKIFLDIVPGFEIAKRYGPASPGGGGSRLYRLLTLSRDRGEFVFLRIDDERAGICYGVLNLGRIVRAHSPRLEIDADANVQVLHQAAPAHFSLHIFTPNGRLVTRRTYSAEGTAVDLVQGPDGHLMVTGASASRSE